MTQIGKKKLARAFVNSARFLLVHALAMVTFTACAFLSLCVGGYYGGVEWAKIGYLVGMAAGAWFACRIAAGDLPGSLLTRPEIPRNEFGQIPEIALAYILFCVGGIGLGVGWILWGIRVGMALGGLPAFCLSVLFLWHSLEQSPGDAKKRLEPYRDHDGNIADQDGYDRECRRMDYERRTGWIEVFFLLTSLFLLLAGVFGGALVYWAIGVPIFVLLQGFGLLKWL